MQNRMNCLRLRADDIGNQMVALVVGVENHLSARLYVSGRVIFWGG